MLPEANLRRNSYFYFQLNKSIFFCTHLFDILGVHSGGGCLALRRGPSLSPTPPPPRVGIKELVPAIREVVKAEVVAGLRLKLALLEERCVGRRRGSHT